MILGLLADDGAEPALDLRGVDLVVVHPALVAGVIGRVDVDALHLPCVFGEQGLEGVEVVALDDEVPGVPAVGERRIRLQQAEGHLLVMADDRVLSDPVERGHVSGDARPPAALREGENAKTGITFPTKQSAWLGSNHSGNPLKD